MDEILKKCIAALECGLALDMPGQIGTPRLERHGWKHDVAAATFVFQMMNDALKSAMEFDENRFNNEKK